MIAIDQLQLCRNPKPVYLAYRTNIRRPRLHLGNTFLIAKCLSDGSTERDDITRNTPTREHGEKVYDHVDKGLPVPSMESEWEPLEQNGQIFADQYL